jgi:non-specific protein-tyrosine kinase
MTELNDFRKYLRAFFRWWWIILLLTGAAVLSSYFYSQRLPRVYEATTAVNVGQSIQVADPTIQDIDTSRRLAQTYALIIRRQPIMQAVIESLDLDMGWRELRSLTSVYLVPTTQIIEISVRASAPHTAAIIANEIAHQLILYSPTLSNNQGTDSDETRIFVTERLDRLREKIVQRQLEIDRKEVAMVNAGLPSEKQAIQKEIDILEGIVSSWESNYARLLAITLNEEDANYVVVIETAQARNSPISPDTRMNTILAGAVGLIVALMIVFVLEYMDDTIKTDEDIVQALNLVPLGNVNHMKSRNETDKLITSQNPFSAASEAYRLIRSNVQFMSVERPRKTLMITSTNPGEGKSLTAANLSLVMAQAGLKTILVDADLRQPKQHKIFKVANKGGLTDLLAATQSDISQVLKKTSVEHLRILTSGTIPPNPTELLGSRQMILLLERLSQGVDIIILDSMPILQVADSVVLSNRVDGVILVIDSARTRRVDVRKSLQMLNQADARIWGAILNRVNNRKSRYYSKRLAGLLGRQQGSEPL